MANGVKKFFNMISLYSMSGAFGVDQDERTAMEEKGWIFTSMLDRPNGEKILMASAMISFYTPVCYANTVFAAKGKKSMGSDAWCKDLADVRGMSAHDLPKFVARRLKL